MKDAEDVELHSASQLVLVACACAYVVFLMYYVYNLPSSSGQAPDVWSFVAFFFREFLLLGFILLAIVVGLLVSLAGLVRRLCAKLFRKPSLL